MKLTKTILGIAIFSVLLISLVFAAENKTELNNCRTICLDNHKDVKENCSIDYKLSSLNCKSEFKNCFFFNKTDRKNAIVKMQQCTKNLTICQRQIKEERNSCLKNNTDNLKICKEICYSVFISNNKPNETNNDTSEPKMHKCIKPDCKNEDKNKCRVVCPLLYLPVCGWFNSNIECFKYPCAKTYSNSCIACSDPNVAFYSDGKCPEDKSIE